MSRHASTATAQAGHNAEQGEAQTAYSPNGRAAKRRAERRRKPPFGAWVTFVCWVLGVGVLLYPSASAWLSQVNQSSLVGVYDEELANVKPDIATQIHQAQRYNEELSSGALLEAGANVAVGSGELRDNELRYSDQLATRSGVMSRLRIPSIKVDLPIYHGTDEDTLLKGLGHLEGTSLPVGGESTRSVITGHRGLASARMFTDLDQVTEGDTFTLETFGEVLTYRVRDVVVVEPDQTETLHQEPGEDLVTLITCTPLGVNTHRILVTGERVSPTPQTDLDAAGRPSGLPGFAWWAVGYGGAILLGAAYLVWSARGPKKAADPVAAALPETDGVEG
ncbi:class C sortase [Leucobacter chinensis]|uniref:class C sortase n=1 Tax=Leucobacter chinensis TaxID=2851010 RepID=UPI001C219B2F|nr:class C sortase [Leucobacter chinensis]